jgi:hypothetical protein
MTLGCCFTVPKFGVLTTQMPWSGIISTKSLQNFKIMVSEFEFSMGQQWLIQHLQLDLMCQQFQTTSLETPSELELGALLQCVGLLALKWFHIFLHCLLDFIYFQDIGSAGQTERNMFKTMVGIYKTIVSPIMRNGDLFRLWDPFKGNLAAWMFVTKDKHQAVVFVFSINSDHWSNLVPRYEFAR